MPVLPPNPNQATPGVNPGGTANSNYSSGDLVTSALRMINYTASGEQPKAAEAADALVVLNHMLDAWNAEGLNIYSVNRLVFSFSAGKDAYTLGPGGDWDTIRPSQIDHMSLLSLANASQPVEYPIRMLSDEQWADIQVKNVQGELPFNVWDNGNYPLRTLTFYFIPNINYQVVIYGWQPLLLFNNLTNLVSLPPGYAEALRYNLAVRLAAEFPGSELRPETAAMAESSLARIKIANIQPIESRCDPAVTPQAKNSLYSSYSRFVSGY